ncbi:MAG: SEC-C metal-binding domain-containing protein [Lutibacter sp.]|nr:SEC-C metal-binding domain-containing protein [Lutibacter sp.]
MTTEDFWNKYINENTLEIFDTACDFFSNELPNEFIENYDVGEVILEIKGHNETAKEFDRVIKFSKLLQEKQPKLYEEYFQYFDDFLIDYYCFHGKKTEVANAFSNFMKKPTQDFDKYLISFKKLLFFQDVNLLKKAIADNFNDIVNTENLISGADYDLSISMFYLTLEDFYEKNNALFNKEEFSGILNKYGFEFDKNFLSEIEQGFFKPINISDKIAHHFIKDREKYLTVLQGYFSRYMKDKNFSFSLSGRLWDQMLIFWDADNKNKKLKPNYYFQVQENNFEKYLSKLSGNLLIDNESEMVAILWGSVYVYDFLKSIEIISQETHTNFIHGTKLLKGKVIGKFTPDLWNFNFVHSWQKPDAISEIEFMEEEKIFKKSMYFKRQTFAQFKNEISEELNKIGELSEFIIEGGKKAVKKPDSPLLTNFFNTAPEFGNGHNIDSETAIIYEPIRTEKKIGRNEPCVCGSGKKYKKCCG